MTPKKSPVDGEKHDHMRKKKATLQYSVSIIDMQIKELK